MEPVDVSAVVELMGAQQAPAAKPSQRRAARVVRVDADGTPWVRVEGGAEETPCASSTVELSPGDTVTVEAGGLRARVVGSTSQPSVSSRRTNELLSPIAYAASSAYGMAQSAERSADIAQRQADAATESARAAATAAADAQSSATSAAEAASAADAKATSAGVTAAAAAGAASAAQSSAAAANANAMAAGRSLSDVERVAGTLNWIAEHGEYVNQAGQAFDPSKVYYTRSGTAPDYVYTVVAEPVAADIASYYVLRVDESIQNYIAAHLWVDSNGLNVASENDETGDKSVTTGWRIGSVLEMLRNGVSWFRLWVQDNAARLRVGRADAGHLLLGSGGVEVVSDEGGSVAEFGETVRVGHEDGVHQVMTGDATTFMDGAKQVAYIAQDKFYAVNAEVSDAFYIGNYSVRNAGDGKLVFGLRR